MKAREFFSKLEHDEIVERPVGEDEVVGVAPLRGGPALRQRPQLAGPDVAEEYDHGI